MNRPSSTISAATIAGIGASVLWEMVATFTTVAPTAGLIAGSTALAAALAGYFKKERVLINRPSSGKK